MKQVRIGNGRGIKQAFIFRIEPADIGNDVPAIIAQPTVVVEGPFGVKSDSHYTATLYSLSASFNEVFKSVEGLLFPMIRAHGTW